MKEKCGKTFSRMMVMTFAAAALFCFGTARAMGQTACLKAWQINSDTAKKDVDDALACWTKKIKNDDSRLEGAYLVGVDLRSLDLKHVDLSYSNLAGANLSGADLRQANLRDATLTNANLSGANLSRAILYAAILNNANLTGADLYDTNLYQAEMNKAILKNAKLSGAKMLRTKLAGADLSGADLSDAELIEVNFATSVLTNAVVLKSTTVGVDFDQWTAKGGIVDERGKGNGLAEAGLINAAKYVVDTGFDRASLNACTPEPNDCSLRGAIINANASTVDQNIEFETSLAGQTILLYGWELAISKKAGSLGIVGPETDRVTVSGNDSIRVFSVAAGTDVSFGRITISEGSTSGEGAGIYNAPGGNVTLVQAKIMECRFSGSGGIFNEGKMVLIDSEVRKNLSEFGGGIRNSKTGALRISGSSISDNAAKGGDGGGVYNDGGEVAIENSTISNNLARVGGGVANEGGKLLLSSSTVSFNETVGDTDRTLGNGGGIYGSEGTFYVFNSTVSGNISVKNGGGISIKGTALIVSSTIADNRIKGDLGAGIYSENALENENIVTGEKTALVISTIIAQNTSRRGDTRPDVSGSFGSSGFNLIGNIGQGSGAGVGFGAKDKIGGGANPVIIPLLGFLDDNGGPTATHTLLCGSPAIDAGSNVGSSVTKDQRGADRLRVYDNPDIDNKSDGADIGSFEVQPPENCRDARQGEVRSDGKIQGPIARYVVDNVSDDASLSACTAAANDCSLRAVINSANASEGDDIISFDDSLAGQTITLGGSSLSIAKNGATTINGLGADKLTISGNQKSRVFFIAPGAEARIVGVTVTGGFTEGKQDGYDGGGGINNVGTLTLENSIVTKNTAFSKNMLSGYGGGIDNRGTLNMSNSTVSDNTASSGSGGIHNSRSVSISGSTVSDNSVISIYGVAGGIRNVMGASLTISGSTINGNKAPRGGGIHNMGSVTITNSTLSNNEATDGEGGGFSNTKGTLLIRNSTVTANKAKSDVGLDEATATFMPAGGGGIYNSGVHLEGEEPATVTIVSTIVAGNKDGGTTNDVWGKFESKGFSLIGDIGTGKNAGTGFGANDLIGGGSNPVIEARLGALGDNGGLVKTHVLLCGSPAIDAGKDLPDTVTDDQRGESFVRLFDDPNINNKGDGTDIGAVEVQQALKCD